jgi:hypothetical protein
MNDNPVYIAGLERSGTSLIYALLGSHPSIAMTRRTNLWTHFYGQYGDISRPENFERCLAMMLRYKRIVRLQPDPERLRSEFYKGEPTYSCLFALMGSQYAERQGKKRWGDKSLNTERYADLIFAAYPNARMIHMIRDPRDRYASALKRWGVSRGGVGAGSAAWLWSLEMAQRNRRRYLDRYMILRYETLVFKPEESLRDVCAFIGEAFSPLMFTLQGDERFRDQGGNSSFDRLEPGRISTGSVGRFRSVMSRRQIAYMERVLGPEMSTFGYTRDSPALAGGERLIFSLLDVPWNEARAAAWRSREAMRDRIGRPVPSYRILPEGGTAAPQM